MEDKTKDNPQDNPQIYLDNGATTRVDPEVAKVVLQYMTEEYGNASSLHSLGQRAKEVLENSRQIIAKTINAKPEEIYFTSGGTESDNIAIRGVAYANKGKGTHIITTQIEHPAVLETCKQLEKEGFKITYLGVDKEGFVNLKELEDAINDQTILVSIIHGNNEIGTIQPVQRIGEICRQRKVYFHTDGVQSYMKVPIDVENDRIDMMSVSAHKIHGPKGVGALYIRKGVRLEKLLYGGSQERKKRPGTENIPGIAGFAKAVEIAQDTDYEDMKKLRDYLIHEVETRIPDVLVNGSRKERLPNNANITFKYIEGESLLLHLDMYGICVSTGSACSSQSLEPSHVLMAIGLNPEIAHGSIRFTLSKWTTKKDIDYTVNNLEGIVENLRKLSPLNKGNEGKFVSYDSPEHDHDIKEDD